ncbi:hypothetical protein GCM10027062_40900 [Nocardioides hungaricus]
MSTLGVEQPALAAGSADWRALAELMTGSSRELGDQSTAGLASSVQGAAASFLAAWSGYAEESAAIATGFADALDAAGRDFWRTDQGAGEELTDLDGRLGPRR